MYSWYVLESHYNIYIKAIYIFISLVCPIHVYTKSVRNNLEDHAVYHREFRQIQSNTFGSNLVNGLQKYFVKQKIVLNWSYAEYIVHERRVVTIYRYCDRWPTLARVLLVFYRWTKMIIIYIMIFFPVTRLPKLYKTYKRRTDGRLPQHWSAHRRYVFTYDLPTC